MVIIGAARQGTALARYLVQRGANVVVTDNGSAAQLAGVRQEIADLKIEWVLGEHPLSLVDNADVVCISGGVPLTIPLVVAAQERGIPLSNDSQIFLENVPCPVIGITGAAGKTTTTTLVGRMASAQFAHSHSGSIWVGGNIGTPLIQDIHHMQPNDVAVMELSSFQLELMDRSPHISAVLNVTPNHLDRHGTMQAYTAAKARILAYQTLDDVAILNRDDAGSMGLASQVQGELITFGQSALDAHLYGSSLHGDEVVVRNPEGEHRVLPVQAIKLLGEHNRCNVLAACAIGSAAGFTVDAMRAGVEGFTGVPHRLEFVRHWGGADWYNDSIATAPERTIAAIKAFDAPLILLVGGRDKELPWEEFAAYATRRVDHFLLFGEAAAVIQEALAAAPTGNHSYTVMQVDTLYEAVEAAADMVEDGDIVLLAPGGTSYDAFVDFEARGNQFKKWVHDL